MHLIKAIVTHKKYLLVLLFILFWTPLIIFLKIAGEVIEQDPIPLDISILQWLHSQANPFLDQVLFTATTIGGIVGIIIITSLTAVGLWFARQRMNVSLLIAGVGGAVAANLILKALFQRDRPSLWQPSIIETSFSFPSGHAMASSALVLCLVLIFWNTKWRWYVTVGGAILALAIGVSRPYFGVHYPSDIIAGWCVSIGWVLIVFAIAKRLPLQSAKFQ